MKEAQQIVDSLARLAALNKLAPVSGWGTIKAAGPNFEPYRQTPTEVPITEAAAKAAMAVMRKDWEAREAQLRRRAAQIGLVL